jgi:hypothetical protein
MKKNLPLYITLATLILIAVGLIVGFTIYKTTSDKNQVASSSSSSMPMEFKTPADILKVGISLECQAEQKGVQTPVYIKNGAFYTKSENQNILLKTDTFYSWQDGQKQGFIFKITPDQLFQAEQNNPMMGGQSMPGGQGISEDFNSFKNTCKPAVISDDKFTVPSDIQFSDLSQLMLDPFLDN